MSRLIASLAGVFAAAILFLGAGPAYASVDDFRFASWDARYKVSLDSEGRAVAQVTETITAQFPDFDQNRGIVRGLPLRFEGAPAAPEDVSVTDEFGAPVPFSLEQDDTFKVILVGDDTYVHGLQTYVLTYTLHDPVIAASETRVDEFYWDVLPLERPQAIDHFSVKVEFAPELAESLTGASACYVGASGSDTRCEIAESGSSVVVPSMQVAPGAGVTVAIGLAPGSVVQPPERVPDFALDTLPMLLSGGAALAGAGVFTGVALMKRKRRTHRGVIVAQYDVPADLPPLIAAPIIGGFPTPIAAQFVHLAVNGVTRIEEPEPPSGILKPKRTIDFRLLDRSRAADALDRQAVNAIFSAAEEGTTFRVPKQSEKFAKKMQNLAKEGTSAAKRRGYFTRERSPIALAFGILALLLVIPAAVLIAKGAERDSVVTGLVSFVLGAIALIAFIVSIPKHRVHTPLGAETYEYLMGVKEFIRVAETDRLRALQSYSGAERKADGTVDVIHIYEKLLPYAMLFGLESEWSRVLEVVYREDSLNSPSWYPAVVLSNGGLGNTMTSFASSMSSSASYSSSSSGGSSGGGFSGGGGGGGFAGGR